MCVLLVVLCVLLPHPLPIPPHILPHREAEVLSVFAAIVRRLKQSMEPEVPKVLAASFEPTLQVGWWWCLDLSGVMVMLWCWCW